MSSVNAFTGSIRATACACTALRRTNRAVSHLYDLVLAPAGLKATQFMILQVIAEAGEIAQCDLARDFSLSIESLSRRLAGARKSGLVRMKTGEHQRRMYSLTPAGHDLLERAWPYWERAQLRLQDALGSDEWSILHGFAERLTKAAAMAEMLPSPNSAKLRAGFARQAQGKLR